MDLVNKCKEWGLYLIVFVLPWQTRLILHSGELNGGYWEYGTYALYAVEIVLWLVIGFSAIEGLVNLCHHRLLSPSYVCHSRPLRFRFSEASESGNPERPRTVIQRIFYWIPDQSLPRTRCGVGDDRIRNVFFILILFFIGIISAINSASPFLAFHWLLKLFEGVALFFIVSKSEINFRKLSIAFIAGAVIQSGLAIWQFASQSVFASKWLGMAAQLPATLGTSVIETNGMRFLRAYGSLPHPNILGAYLLVAIVLLFFFIAPSPHPLPQGERRKKRMLLVIGYWLLVTLLITGLFLTFSRAAWLGLVLVLVFFCITPSPYPLPQGERKKRISFLILLTTYYLLLTTLFWPLVQTRLTGTERLEVKSTTTRMASYSEAWQLIKKHLWLGVGPGNYTLAVHNEIDSTRQSWDYQPVHNVYLLVLAELGIFGFFGFMGLVFGLPLTLTLSRPLGFASEASKGRGKCMGLGLAMTILILFLFDHFWWSLPFGVWSFWLLMGIMLRNYEMATKATKDV